MNHAPSEQQPAVADHRVRLGNNPGGGRGVSDDTPRWRRLGSANVRASFRLGRSGERAGPTCSRRPQRQRRRQRWASQRRTLADKDKTVEAELARIR
jgi:hypothetical protein